MELTQGSRALSHARDDDDALVDAARHGDDRAFERLYARYRERIHAFILSRVKDHGRSEDIAQDVFMSALRQLRASDQPIMFKPWLYTIARNACIDEFRRGPRGREVLTESEEDLGAGGRDRPLLSAVPTPTSAVESKQSLQDLRGAFDGLSESQHRLLVLREFEGLSYEEIGERLGMTKQMVESGLFRARRKLSEEYDELASGRRCGQIQTAIDTGTLVSARGLGIKDRRRYSRHLAHCQPCRHQAMMAGVDGSLLKPRRSIAAKIAALLPFPLLRWPWRHGGGKAGARAGSSAGGHHAAGGALQSVASTAGPSAAGTAAGAGVGAGAAGIGLGQAAVVAALALAGAGGGLVIADHTGAHHHRAATPHVIRRSTGAGTGATTVRTAGSPPAATTARDAGAGRRSAAGQSRAGAGATTLSGTGATAGTGSTRATHGTGASADPTTTTATSATGSGTAPTTTAGARGGSAAGTSSPTAGKTGSTVSGLAQGATGTVKGVVQGATGTVKGVAQGATGTVKGVAQGATGTVKGVAQGATGTVKGVAQGATGTVKGVAQGATGTVKGVAQGATGTVKGVAQGAGGAVGTLTGSGSAGSTGSSGTTSSAGSTAPTSTGSTATTPTATTPTTSNPVSTTLGTVATGVGTTVGGLLGP